MRHHASCLPFVGLSFCCLAGCPGDEQKSSSTTLTPIFMADNKPSVVVATVNPNLPICMSSNLRPAPVLDELRTVPTTDPLTCLDQTPKVGLVRAGSLPQELRARLSHLDDDDRLLLYVPAADAEGVRKTSLVGKYDCNPDLCPKALDCGRPTEQKCPAPKADACATALPADVSPALTLASSVVQVKVGGAKSSVPVRGVIIAAAEINLAGPLRTNGQDLVLLAKTVHAASDTSIDGSALRQSNGQSRAGGTIVIAAGKLDGTGNGVFVSSYGSPGALPSTTVGGVGRHWDCPDKSPDPNGNPTCYPCLGAMDTCNDPPAIGYSYYQKQCLTRVESTPGTLTYIFEYPAAPATLPLATMLDAPSGHDGGPSGTVALLLGGTNTTLSMSTAGGVGSRGLQGFAVYARDLWACPAGALECYVSQLDGTSWRARDGKDGAMPYTFVSYRTPDDGSDFEPNLAPGSRSKQPYIVDRLLADVADELVLPEQYAALAERAYRAGNLAAAKLGYALALASLGQVWLYPCSLSGRATALQKELEARALQLDAGLDWAGRAADWAPFTPPAMLTSLVQSELQQSAQVAADIKLNALLSITSANLQGSLVTAMEQADGKLAELEAKRNDAALKEKQVRLGELQAYVQRNQSQLDYLKSQLWNYYLAQSSQPSGIFDALTAVGEAAGSFVGAAVNLYTNASFGNAVGAAKAGLSLYNAFDKLSSSLSGNGFVCEEHAECVDFKQRISQAQLDLYAARQAVQAAQYAIQAEEANAELFEARRQLAQDVATIYSQNHYVVRDFDALSRAGRYLCQYGRLVTDEAAATLFALKRSAAVWDVPAPLAEQSTYAGAGGRYDFDFLALIDSSCQSLGCTLWGDYNQFLAERPLHIVSNSQDVYLGTPTDGLGDDVAALLHDTPLASGRVELGFGLFEEGGVLRLGVRPTPEESALLSGIAPTVVASTSFAGKKAVQLYELSVHAFDGAGTPLRYDFPWQVSRPASEHYVNQITPASELSLAVTVPPGRQLDSGRLLDRLSYDGTGFVLRTCCDNSAPLARPESLAKSWVLWIPVCAAGVAPSQDCATEAEIQNIARVELRASLKYKVE